MNIGNSIAGGVAGSVALTALHESLRRYVPDAPRLDQIGRQIVFKITGNTNGATLYYEAMAGDLIANSIFYSFVGPGKRSWINGMLLGAGAGVAAVTLPKYLGLKEGATNRSPKTTALTIGLYTLAGLVAGITHSIMEKKRKG